MADITNLAARISYNNDKTDLPICIVLHGWSGDMLTLGDIFLNRLRTSDLFVVSVGMRGRNGADGTADASAREIYDIYDAIQYIKTNYAAYVSSDKAAIVGYSGGGGNALAAACKFPDLFNVVVAFFGMSDYGRDATHGWYANNSGSYTAGIATAVGDTPANVPNNYYARDATVAIQNYSGGYLYLYHDEDDTTVPVVHSTRIKTALDNASLSNYSYNVSTATDDLRWSHGYPADNADLIETEATWIAKIKAQEVWTIPASGTVTVIGYIVTKRFTIWLNSGLDAAAMVVYNTTTDTYTVTPLTTGNITVVITQGAKTATATISEATEMVVT